MGLDTVFSRNARYGIGKEEKRKPGK